MKNELYDVLIIGASKEAVAASNLLVNSYPTLKIACVAKQFKYGIPKGVVYEENTAVFMSYMKGLIMTTMTDGTKVCSLNVVISTGTIPNKVLGEAPYLFYRAEDLPTRRTKNLFIFGKAEYLTPELSNIAADKFKNVYVGRDNTAGVYSIIPTTSDSITDLAWCNIINISQNTRERVIKITLDTYAELTCSCILGQYGSKPELFTITKGMAEVDDLGYLVTNADGSTTKIPKIYGIGTCTTQARSYVSMVHRMSEDNNWSKQ